MTERLTAEQRAEAYSKAVEKGLSPELATVLVHSVTEEALDGGRWEAYGAYAATIEGIRRAGYRIVDADGSDATERLMLAALAEMTR